jgi:hypothetical protein
MGLCCGKSVDDTTTHQIPLPHSNRECGKTIDNIEHQNSPPHSNKELFYLDEKMCRYIGTVMIDDEILLKKVNTTSNDHTRVLFANKDATYTCVGQSRIINDRMETEIINIPCNLYLEKSKYGISKYAPTWTTHKLIIHIEIDNIEFDMYDQLINKTYVKTCYNKNKKEYIIETNEEFKDRGIIEVDFGLNNSGTDINFLLKSH